MKTVLIIALIFGIHVTLFSQAKETKGNNEKAMKSVELPEIIVKNAGKDFSYYLPDMNPDPNVRKLQSEFIAYDIGKDYEGYDNYLVTLQRGQGILIATYNSNGKLTTVVERYTNIQLPIPVLYSIYKTYPGWQIVNEKFLYSQEDGDIKKKEYNLKLKKENEIIKLKVNPKGEIIANVD